MNEFIELRVSTLLADQAYKLVSEIERVDERLSVLGDSEEDRVESIVLRALRRHLVRELREISWTRLERSDSGISHSARVGAVVKA